MPRPSGLDEWDDLALRAIPAYLEQVEAAVWPEIEAQLRELSWATYHLDRDFPATWGIDPHVLNRVAPRLEADETIVAETVELSGRLVTAYLALFAEVSSRLSFHDATLVDDLDAVPGNIAWFFSEGVRKPTADGTAVMEAQAARWAEVAPIVASYTRLRDEIAADERRELWASFAQDVVGAGFYERGEWAPGETDVEP